MALFAEPDDVADTQNSAPSPASDESSLHGTDATPAAETSAPTMPLSVKHSRNLPRVHVSPSAVQSVFVPQARNVSMAQNCSNGPPLHSPSLPVVGLHVASLH